MKYTDFNNKWFVFGNTQYLPPTTIDNYKASALNYPKIKNKRSFFENTINKKIRGIYEKKYNFFSIFYFGYGNEELWRRGKTRN